MTDEHPAPLEVTERHDDQGSYELQLAGEVDLSSLPVIKTHLDRILSAAPVRVSFELSEVGFMDSSGIGMLLEVADAVPDIALVNPSPAVSRLVELCGLRSILPMTMVPTLPVTL
ncbi:STAS domain-containing protein [uncultured Jatrophihabitans sp.]|uniref:STAS domain-containing protein n=1 Tax=uncultured Jatrophihabitans sp. TaxID=1610747 RepID=UPI0035CB60DF